MSKPLALIIEDDPKLGAIYSLALQSKFDTEIITDGQSALDRLAVAAPAIIMLDFNLPKVSGGDILKYIRAESRLAQTKIIIVTGDSNQHSILSAQADLAMLKPVSPLQLSELAARLCAV